MNIPTSTVTPAAQTGATPSTRNQAAFDRAVAEVAEAGRRLLDALGPPAQASCANAGL